MRGSLRRRANLVLMREEGGCSRVTRVSQAPCPAPPVQRCGLPCAPVPLAGSRLQQEGGDEAR